MIYMYHVTMVLHEFIALKLPARGSLSHMSRDRHSLLLRNVTEHALHGNGPSAYIENTVPLLVAACVLPALSSNRRCLHIHCLATGLHAKIHRHVSVQYIHYITILLALKRQREGAVFQLGSLHCSSRYWWAQRAGTEICVTGRSF